MEQRKKRIRKRSKTKIIPPKKKRPESLSRDEVRSINKKRIKRKRKAERLALLTALALVVASIGVVLVLAIFFKVDTVTIKGDKVYADKEVILQSGIETGDSLVRITENKINDALTKNLPYIGEITLEKKLPDTVIITVSATREIAAFQNGAGFVLVDENGKVLDSNASMLRDNVAIVNGLTPKNIIEGELIEFGDEKTTTSFLQLLSSIKSSKMEFLTEISLKDGNWNLRYDDRITIIVPITEKLETKLRLAVEALKMEDEKSPYTEGVLDLSMGDKGYFRRGPETTEPATTDVSASSTDTTGTAESTTTKTE